MSKEISEKGVVQGGKVSDPGTYNGEKLIPDIPEYGGRGGSQQAAEHYAATDFQSMFGRLPTKSELAQVSAAYMSDDPNVANVSGGKAFVGQYYNQIQNSPDKQAARQKDEYKKNAPQHYGSIDQMFQSSIGRAASDQEKEHFGSLMASGQLDAYQLGQFVNQLPDSVRKQDKEFRTQLSGELDTQNQQYFSDKVMPSIQNKFLQQGRSVDSSGYASALALAAQDQSNNRESFLSNLSASQYQNQTANARGDYQDTLNRYYGNQDYSRDRNAFTADRTYGRLNEMQDYNTQKQAYDQYLRKYGKRSNGVGQMVGGLIGGGLGAIWGPTGAKAGYQIGSGLGGAAQTGIQGY